MTKFNDESDTYTVKIKGETNFAYLVCDGNDSDVNEVWLPKSQCKFPRGTRIGAVVDVKVPNWLAEDRGLLG